uniref:SGNH hydrolase-type esterase domain-containing protein n=1 Tax=Otus sunia TaxID=257818 RepID=A0A8C8E8K1_9STRI
MVSTRLRSTTSKNMATQTEQPRRHAAVQVPGCRECLSLSVLLESRSDSACVRCDQLDDLLSLVAELKEEVERLRSIRECEREIDWWSSTLTPTNQQELIEAPGKVCDPSPSRDQAERGDLRDEGVWKQVPAQGGKKTLSRPPSPSMVPLHNRFGALELLNEDTEEESESNNEEAQGPPRPSHSRKGIKTSSKRNPRRVIVVGDSMLRGAEGPICRPDPHHREVCCLPGARVKDITRRLPSLVKPKDYYPLLVFQVGSDDVTRRSIKSMKRDFKALGKMIKGSGAQVVFSSIPPVGGMDEDEHRRAQQINSWLQDWCHCQGFG